jgi:hypothetical protein
MESEQSQNFNERLSQWVANQGFWFQIRYSMSSRGGKGTALFHLLRLGTRLLVFLLLVAVGSWIYLVKRTESKKYAVGLKDSIHAALGASETEVSGFSRTKGRMEIGRVVSEGGSKTFFNSLEARNIRCKMGLLDGVTGKWDPGPISISTLDMDLRAGTDDAESAKALAEALFRQNDNVLVNTVDVGAATLRWGYTERTRGTIEGSALTINRIGAGWRMTFSGGTFSQNWLRNLEIVSLVVLSDPDGMTFEKAEFRRGQGTVDLSGIRLAGGERPSVSGIAKVRMLGLDTILPPALRSFLEGTISGDFKVSGSTNSSEGIGFEGMVSLDGRDAIVLRERLPLLEALSVVDYVRNYYRVEFKQGSFRLKTGNGGIRISELTLKAQDIFTLEGELLVRIPTPEEAKEDSAKSLAAGTTSPVQPENDPSLPTPSEPGGGGFTLNPAGKVARGHVGDSKGSPLSLLGRLGLNLEERRLEQQAAERLSQALRYEGSFLISLLPDALERAPKLMERFPVDPRTGRIPIVVPVKGTLYQLTEEQAKDIYQQRTR